MSQLHMGPGIANAAGYNGYSGPGLDQYLNTIQIMAQNQVHYGTVTDRIATSPVVRNQTGPGKGSTLRFMRVGGVHVHPLDNNGKFQQNDVNVSFHDITLGQAYGWAIKISKKDLQWQPAFVNNIITTGALSAARSMQRIQEQNVINAAIQGASVKNQGHYAGMLTNCINLGTCENPVKLDNNNIVHFFRNIETVVHEMGLESGANATNVFTLVPTELRAIINLASPLMCADKSGIAPSALFMTPEQTQQLVAPMGIEYTHCMPEACVPGVDANGNRIYPIVFGSRSATGYAVYADSVEYIDRVALESSVYIQGEFCSGEAAIDDCHLGVAYVTIDKSLINAFPVQPKPAQPPAQGAGDFVKPVTAEQIADEGDKVEVKLAKKAVAPRDDNA